MPINLLGEPKHPIKKIKTPAEIEMHIPKKELKRLEKEKKRQEKLKVSPQPELEAKTELGEVNLIKAFKIYLFKRRLTFTILFVIIILIVGSLLGYFAFSYKPKPKLAVNKPPALSPSPVVNFNVNKPLNLNTPVAIEPTPVPTPPPLPPSPPPVLLPVVPQPLPDTELAPLRGTLVKFKGEPVIYLIELNGELRKVDLQTVIFANGQSIKQIGPEKIYTINDRFINVRKGKDVIGFVEWDPRILTVEELQPYL